MDRCVECGRQVEEELLVRVDDAPVCRACLHGGAAPVLLYPIGYVLEGLSEQAAHGEKTPGESRLELLPGMERFMHGLAEEKRLQVLWVLDRSPGVRTRFNRRDGKEVGYLASRSPNRLNSVAVTDVEVVRVEGLSLWVRGLDAFPGSPVVDLKHLPEPAPD